MSVDQYWGSEPFAVSSDGFRIRFVDCVAAAAVKTVGAEAAAAFEPVWVDVLSATGVVDAAGDGTETVAATEAAAGTV